MDRARRAKNPEKIREQERLRRLKLSDEDKDAIRRRQMDWRHRKRAERLAGRTCAECGEPIPLEVNDAQITCSPACAKERRRRSAQAYYRRKGINERGTDESSAALSAAMREKWTKGLNFKPRKCRGCSTEFMPSSGPQRYCTEACSRTYRAAAKYGMDGADLHRMMNAQGGACSLCGDTPRTRLHIDHCHRTGAVRGLFCGDCNTALGRFGDDPERLRAAIRYLERG